VSLEAGSEAKFQAIHSSKRGLYQAVQQQQKEVEFVGSYNNRRRLSLLGRTTAEGGRVCWAVQPQRESLLGRTRSSMMGAIGLNFAGLYNTVLAGPYQ